MFPSVGQTEHSSSPRLVDWILRVPHSQAGHSSILPKGEQTSPQSLWFAEEINKGKLKWRPNLKRWTRDYNPAEPPTSRCVQCWTGLQWVVCCKLLNVQANQKELNKNIKNLSKNIFVRCWWVAVLPLRRNKPGGGSLGGYWGGYRG